MGVPVCLPRPGLAKWRGTLKVSPNPSRPLSPRLSNAKSGGSSQALCGRLEGNLAPPHPTRCLQGQPGCPEPGSFEPQPPTSCPQRDSSPEARKCPYIVGPPTKLIFPLNKLPPTPQQLESAQTLPVSHLVTQCLLGPPPTPAPIIPCLRPSWGLF